MSYSTAAKNAMLNYLATIASHVSLHTADPGDNGANEVAGGAPAYARKAITWNSASGGEMYDDGTDLLFDIPAGTTVSYVGFWSAISAGTFYGSYDVPNETYGNQGTYTMTSSVLDLNS